MQTIMVGYHINCHNQNDVYIVISRIEAAAFLIFVAKYYFYVRVASIYGISVIIPSSLMYGTSNETNDISI